MRSGTINCKNIPTIVDKHDSDLMNQIITKIKPHQIYAAGDLADPHGTHAGVLSSYLVSISQET